MSDLGLDLITSGPILGTHKRRMGELLKHFHKQGLTLAVIGDRKHLNRSLSTLKRYARKNALSFPDYVPRALKPKKEKKAKKRRA